MQTLVLFTLRISLMIAGTAIGFYSCGQDVRPGKYNESSGQLGGDSNSLNVESWALPNDLARWLHTEYDYRDAGGNGIIIQNGYPRGGGYQDTQGVIRSYESGGTRYGFGILWSRIINQSDSPIEVSITLPADSISFRDSPGGHCRVYLPPNKMTIENLSDYSYGINGVTAFLNSHFEGQTHLEKVIDQDEEHMFYVVLLSHFPDGGGGGIRTGFSLDQDKLFYEVTAGSLGVQAFPSGYIARQE